MSPPIRVLIADDFPIVREGLCACLTREADLCVVGQAANGAEAVALYSHYRPDVVLMDCRMPHMDGIEALSAIRQQDPQAKVILLSASGGDEEIHRALQAGARSYLLKTASWKEIVSTMRAVSQGQTLLPDEVAQQLAQRDLRPPLTSREQEVLRLIVAGKNNREIGAMLGVAEGTVKSHVNHLLNKMEVDDRTQAAVLALRRGMARLE